MPVFSLSDIARIAFKVILFGSFITALISFSVFFVGFITDTYTVITSSFSQFSTQSMPSAMACLFGTLGIDQFLTSAFSIVFTAGAFWLVSIAVIHGFKMLLRAYDFIFKATT